MSKEYFAKQVLEKYEEKKTYIREVDKEFINVTSELKKYLNDNSKVGSINVGLENYPSLDNTYWNVSIDDVEIKFTLDDIRKQQNLLLAHERGGVKLSIKESIETLIRSEFKFGY